MRVFSRNWKHSKKWPREFDDFKGYYESLIREKGTTTMGIKKLRVLAIEIFKIMNNIDQS